MKKYALISVSDKTNLEIFARKILNLDYIILSTGGTLKFLKEKNIPATKVEEYIGYPEILEGRVKTLHPKIHGGILGDISNPLHLDEMKKNNINHIGIVVINLYPFESVINTPKHKFADAIANIDIGGPSLIRSAAKNFQNVVVVVSPDDYNLLANEFENNNGKISLGTRKLLAYKAFKTTCRYDFLIRSYLGHSTIEENKILAPKEKVAMPEKYKLSYGENPHQEGSLIKLNKNPNSLSIIYGKQLQGKHISYNNVNDANSAINLLYELKNYKHCFIAVKHMCACGVGCDSSSNYNAWRKCYEGDKTSIFGGIVATNYIINEKIAEEMKDIFLEIIIAPGFSKEALEIFKKKPKLKLFEFSCEGKIIDPTEYKTINGGILMQTTSKPANSFKEWKIVSKNTDGSKYENDLNIAWKIVKHLKSNAIAIVQNGQLLGVGTGQGNRYLSVKLALKANSKMLKNAVLASDAFFPMTDSIDEIAKYLIKAIVQPGGSIKDKLVIAKANEYNLIMYFSNERYFLH